MKGIILFLFVFTVPVVVFLATMLYGGISTDVLKKELIHADVYKKTSELIINSTSSTDDPASSQFAQVVKNRMTPSYIQEKAETTLDESALWIEGSTTTPPVVSFREIKEDLITQYPELIPTIQQATEEMKKEQSQAQEETTDIVDADPTADMTKNIDMINSLITSDFSFTLTSYLQGIKGFYTFIRIATPVLVVFLLLYLFLLFIWSSTGISRLHWIGATFLMTGIWGFLVIAMHVVLIKLFSQFALQVTNSFMELMLPILSAIMTQFAETFIYYQGIVSVVFCVLAALCFILSSLHKTTPSTPKTSAKTPKK